MMTQISEIVLEGAGRALSLKPGLNIVTGPIASGKTTLIRYFRFLLGGALGQLPKEAKASVTAVSGTVNLDGKIFSIARPAVSTPTARVEIAGEEETWRLPAYVSSDGTTYTKWLLEQLALPRLEVPSAPTKPTSEPTPVSINDYFLYSYLTQDELGFTVFGHRDPFKNIKRKYVFEIVYGLYDVSTAQLQDQLREVNGQLRELQARKQLIQGVFKDTPLENKVRIEHELRETTKEIRKIEKAAVAIAAESTASVDTERLQTEVLELEARSAKLDTDARAEHQALTNLRELAAQLESQSSKLTRSIVSDKYLTDLEFVVCPRCGTELDQRRIEAALCYLCLQVPSLQVSRETLVSEQEAVEQQLSEAQMLLREREERAATLQKELSTVKAKLGRARLELDFLTKSYVSAHAAEIASTAAARAKLMSRMAQLEDYLGVLARAEEAQALIVRLVATRDGIVQELESATAESTVAQERIQHLNKRFNQILEQTKPPQFGEETSSNMNPTTYLPIYHGRPFTELSSPGLATLVNIAHALAHHLTSIELDLKLPQFLVIDGLSEHLGQEGLDPERLQAVYELLIETSHGHPELQIIVVDNEVPPLARPFVSLELSEEDRLIRA